LQMSKRAEGNDKRMMSSGIRRGPY